jgi:hypothetical protein
MAREDAVAAHEVPARHTARVRTRTSTGGGRRARSREVWEVGVDRVDDVGVDEVRGVAGVGDRRKEWVEAEAREDAGERRWLGDE